MANDDRIQYFRGYDLILVSRKMSQRLSYIWSKFLEIRRKKFDAAVAIHPHLYLYASGKVIYLNGEGKMDSQHRSGMIKIGVFGLALIAGEIMTHLLFPMVICKSIQYKKKANQIAEFEPTS